MKNIKKTKREWCLVELEKIRKLEKIKAEEMNESMEIKILFKFPRLISRVAFVGHIKKGRIKIITLNNRPLIVGDNINTKKKKPTLKGDIKTIYHEAWDSGNFQPVMAKKIIITAKKAIIEEEVILGL